MKIEWMHTEWWNDQKWIERAKHVATYRQRRRQAKRAMEEERRKLMERPPAPPAFDVPFGGSGARRMADAMNAGIQMRLRAAQMQASANGLTCWSDQWKEPPTPPSTRMVRE